VQFFKLLLQPELSDFCGCPGYRWVLPFLKWWSQVRYFTPMGIKNIYLAPFVVSVQSTKLFNPHFSQEIYCDAKSTHACCVALPQTPRRTYSTPASASVVRVKRLHPCASLTSRYDLLW